MNAARLPTDRGEAERAAIARAALIERARRHPDTVRTFARIRDARREAGLTVAWEVLPTWLEDPERMSGDLNALGAGSGDDDLRREIEELGRRLELPAAWPGRVADLRFAFQAWLVEFERRERMEGAKVADVWSVVAEVSFLARLELRAARLGLRATLEMPAGPVESAPERIPRAVFDRLRPVLERAAADADVPADRLASVLADLEARIDDDWFTLVAEVIEAEGTENGPPAPVLQPPDVSGLPPARQARAVNEWHELQAALIAQADYSVKQGRRPGPLSTERIRRDVDLWWRHNVLHESVRSLAITEFGSENRRQDVREAMERAAELLALVDSA